MTLSCGGVLRTPGADSRKTCTNPGMRCVLRIGRTGHGSRATLPGMYPRRILAFAAITLMGCGSLDISITTTRADDGDGDSDESSTGPSVVGSTGLGGSGYGSGGTDSDHVDTSTSTGASSGEGSSDSSTGGGLSSSTGEPPSECFVDPWIDGQLACWCDGVLSDPIACGCADYPDGCECDHGSTTSPLPCLAPGQCTAVLADGGWACLCEGIISEPALCGCTVDALGGCMCPGGDPAPCVLESCFLSPSGGCWCGVDCPNGACTEWPLEVCA